MPTEIQISIKLIGDGFASPTEMIDRDLIEETIEEQGIGEIVQAGSGMGFMDLAVEVSDATTALATLEKLIADMNLTDRTTLKVILS
jgi:hypothetical protein